MEITLNNRIEYFENDALTINELLAIKNYTFKMLIIKVNGQLIRKPEYDSKTIHNGDKVTVLHLVSGG